MKGGVGLYFAGAGVLLALAGCGRSFMSGERAPWRHQAEISCLKSGAVKVGAGVVQIEPIEGPGMCGADFPLKVAALGESSPAISYSDDLRPPGSIPANSAQMPRWPINEPRYAPPAPVGSSDRTIGADPEHALGARTAACAAAALRRRQINRFRSVRRAANRA